MAETSVISESLKKMIGQEITKAATFEVSKRMIRKFAVATEDSNPLWQDEEYAKKSKWGGIIAPPFYPTAFLVQEFQDWTVKEELSPLRRFVPGGTEQEYYQPIKPGDEITVIWKLLDAREREGKSGKMVILSLEATYANQKGEIVAKERFTGIRY
jgi:acyl dehydratase